MGRYIMGGYSPYDTKIREVVTKIKGVKGIRKALVLTKEDRRKIVDLEKSAEKRVMMGLGQGDNQGIKKVLTSDVVVAFITEAEYEWPRGPNIVITRGGRIIGEELSPSRLEEVKKCKNVILLNNFALYKDRIPKLPSWAQKPPIVVFPAKPCPEAEEVSGIGDAVLGSPSPPSDIYLKERMKVNQKNGQLGTILIGFNCS